MDREKERVADVAATMEGGGHWEPAWSEMGRAWGLDRWLVRRMLRSLHSPPLRVVLWDGQEISAGDSPGEAAAPPAARVLVRDRGALYRLISNPEMQLGELYSDGRLAVEGSLVAFLDAAYRSASAGGTFSEHVPGWVRRSRTNTRRLARANIHHHYDIGNDFYRLWLDEAMVYTCGEYFPRADATLEAAQQAKMEHVCRKLRLRAGERVVEAGCGWGSLAIYMAQHYGVNVKAYNISREQVAFARERARGLGLDGRIEFVEDDYRNIMGKFDAFVSVGMLEHVGPSNYRTLGGVIDRCLTESGRGLIHSIGRNRPTRMNAWIAARVFPGGYVPSLQEMSEVFEPFSFSILDVENLRLHYARTLGHWLARFERSSEQVRRMFDERFVRMWRLYLAGSLVAFNTGWMQLFQVAFARAMNNDIPMTREHLYAKGTE